MQENQNDFENKKNAILYELQKRKNYLLNNVVFPKFLRKILRFTLLSLSISFIIIAIVFITNFIKLNSNLIEKNVLGILLPVITQGKFPVHISKITGNLLTGIEIRFLQIKNPFLSYNSNFITIPRVYIKYSPLDILFNELVVEKIVIDSPIIVLSRAKNGRYVWDFSEYSKEIISNTENNIKSSLAKNIIANNNNKNGLTIRTNESDTEKALEIIKHFNKAAKRFLKYLEINNLSIFIPSVFDLLPDQSIANFLKLLNTHILITNIDVKVLRYLSKFVTTYRVILEQGLNYLSQKKCKHELIQCFFTKDNNKENYSFSIKTSHNHQYEVSLYKSEEDNNYSFNLYDSSKKEDFFVFLTLDPSQKDIFKKFKNLNSTIIINLQNLNNFLKNASGNICFRAKSYKEQNLLQGCYELNIKNVNFYSLNNLKLENLSTNILASNSVLLIENFSCNLFKQQFNLFYALLDFQNTNHIKSILSGIFLNTKFYLEINQKKINSTISKLFINSQIDPKQIINIEVDKIKNINSVIYRNIKLKYHVNLETPEKLLVSKLANFLIKDLNKNVYKLLDEIKYCGKIQVDAYIPSTKNIENVYITIETDRLALLHNKLNIKDISGKFSYSSNKCNLNYSAETENFYLLLNATFENFNIYETTLSVYNKNKTSSIVDITKIRDFMEISNLLPFSKLVIYGNKILEIKFCSQSSDKWLKFASYKIDVFLQNSKLELTNFNLILNFSNLTFEKIYTFSEIVDLILSKLLFDISFKIYSADFKISILISFIRSLRKFALSKLGITIFSENVFDLLYEITKDLVQQYYFKNAYYFSNFLNKSLIEKIVSNSKSDILMSINVENDNSECNIHGNIKSAKALIGITELNLLLTNFIIEFFTNKKGELEVSSSSASKSLKLLNNVFDLDKFVISGRIHNYFFTHSSNNKQLQAYLNIIIKSGLFNLSSIFDIAYEKKIENFCLNHKLVLTLNDLYNFANLTNELSNNNLSLNGGKLHCNLESKINGKSFKNSCKFDLENLNFDINLFNKARDRKITIPIKDTFGNILFEFDNKESSNSNSLTFSNISARILDARTSLNGEFQINNKLDKSKISLKAINASFKKISLQKVWNLLISSGFYKDYADVINDLQGELCGDIKLLRHQEKYLGSGSFEFSDGEVKLKYIKDKIYNISGKMLINQMNETANKSAIEISDLQAKILRSELMIPKAIITTANERFFANIEAEIIKTYPTDLIKIFANANLPKIDFPNEGSIGGKLKIVGDIASPTIESNIKFDNILFEYKTDNNKYLLPFGNSEMSVLIYPTSNYIKLLYADLGILGGSLQAKNAYALIKDSKIINYRIVGNIKNVNLSKLQINNFPFEGYVYGDFEAYKLKDNVQESVFKLYFENLKINELPFDQSLIDSIGIEFIKNPDFRLGNLNFYVSTLEDKEIAGKLRIADGVLAGPDMRIEIQNSEFDPYNLSLVAKLILNPQSLRKTTFGKKLGKMTKHLQDEATGLPYIDLSVSGSWTSPKLIGKVIERKTHKRAKKNFIESIFGGRRVRKASVEDLIRWFPGWKPN